MALPGQIPGLRRRIQESFLLDHKTTPLARFQYTLEGSEWAYLAPIKIPLPIARQIPMILNVGFALSPDTSPAAEAEAEEEAEADSDMTIDQEPECGRVERCSGARIR